MPIKHYPRVGIDPLFGQEYPFYHRSRGKIAPHRINSYSHRSRTLEYTTNPASYGCPRPFHSKQAYPPQRIPRSLQPFRPTSLGGPAVGLRQQSRHPQAVYGRATGREALV